MYVIFETGGKQYKVSAGDVLRIEKIAGDQGDKVKLGSVLAFSDGSSLKTGTPYLDAATVNATITALGKGEKVIIFKFKAKKDYRKKQGHRQPYTEIEIDNFTIDGKEYGDKPVKESAPVEEPKIEEPEAEELEAEELADEEAEAIEEESEGEDPETEAEEETAEEEAPGGEESEEAGVEEDEEADDKASAKE